MVDMPYSQTKPNQVIIPYQPSFLVVPLHGILYLHGADVCKSLIFIYAFHQAGLDLTLFYSGELRGWGGFTCAETRVLLVNAGSLGAMWTMLVFVWPPSVYAKWPCWSLIHHPWKPSTMWIYACARPEHQTNSVCKSLLVNKYWSVYV